MFFFSTLYKSLVIVSFQLLLGEIIQQELVDLIPAVEELLLVLVIEVVLVPGDEVGAPPVRERLPVLCPASRTRLHLELAEVSRMSSSSQSPLPPYF